MNCGEMAELAPLYVSGELDEALAAACGAHLHHCSSCAREMEQQREIDRRLRDALAEEDPDPGWVAAEVRCRIGAENRTRLVRRLAAVAAGVVAVLLAWYILFPAMQAPRLLVVAAGDHRREVVEREPKRWRSAAEEIMQLARRQGIGLTGLWNLGNYRLDRARLCRLEGHIFLHLVYVSGAQQVSVFLRRHDGAAGNGVRLVSAGGEQLAAFVAGNVHAMCVAEDAAVVAAVAESAEGPLAAGAM
jgi:anti-sigma factor RsiW